MLKIRKAIISVWDKKGILEFVRKLKPFNVEIISTGKTASLLKKGGSDPREVSHVTAFPEILSGRVKTLHPRIFGAILANKKHPLHLEEISNLQIEPVDMVVVNFYPFGRMIKEKISFDQALEYIDIGGPALLRAGAKNFKNVACVSSPRQYKRIIDELERNNGCVREQVLEELAGEVFKITKEYDTAIYSFLQKKEVMIWDMEKITTLRYGENPHQKAMACRPVGAAETAIQQYQGKQLSFNNLLDLDTAFSLVRSFSEPAAVIVKHAAPCGASLDKHLHKAYLKAYRADARSSFGGIVGLNRKVDRKTAHEIIKSGFKECIIAPGYSKEALRFFSDKKNLRVLEADFSHQAQFRDIKRTSFGYLMQEADTIDFDKSKITVVSDKKPTALQMKDLFFAWKVVKYARSNAIVVAKNRTTLGIGNGQPSRVGAVEIALKHSDKKTNGAVIASDAFFPKEDSIRMLSRYGIKSIIQPGGSIRDDAVISLCNKYNLSMVFTGIRHFRH